MNGVPARSWSSRSGPRGRHEGPLKGRRGPRASPEATRRAVRCDHAGVSDPHEQANAQQIEWLLGALADIEVQGQPVPPSSPLPSDLTEPLTLPTEPDDLH